MKETDTNSQQNLESNLKFHNKVWITVGIFALVFTLFLILKSTFNVFLLILAGTVIAVFFRGLSNFILNKTKWKEGICIAISIIGSFIVIVTLIYLIGSRVESQIAELSKTLPKTIENVKVQLKDSPFGAKIMEKISSEESIKKMQEFASQFFQSTFGIFGDIYVILFIGIFFTISPKTYLSGIIQLVPKKGKPKANEVLNKLGVQLLNWLKGKLFSMLIVFILTAIGLAIIGIPLWLVLALIAGLISFIPNFGPLIALLPAVLIAFMEGPVTAAIVAGLYVFIQFVESNFITTLVQKKLLNMPPALIIIAQLLMGALIGGWGLVLATPVTVIIIVIVQELYVNNQKS
jgi:predicted PurR-regulated permease PerM